MVRSGRARRVLKRGMVIACLGALAVGVACGSNPELVIDDLGPNDGGADIGEPCEEESDCLPALNCGDAGKCVAPCTEDPRVCGPEVCLPSGACSAGLGRECKSDDDCSKELKCSDSFKRCSLPCDPEEEATCPDNSDCRPDGTCRTPRDIMLGMGGAGNDGGPDGSGGSGSCIDVVVDFAPQVPTVLLLIDRSGSMNADGGFGAAVQDAVDAGTYALGDCPTNKNWRWNVVRDVLFNASKGIIKPLEDRVRFGMSLYSSQDGRIKVGSPDEIDPAKMCPELIEVPIALNNTDAMLGEFECNDIADDTPTGESLEAAAATLVDFDEPGPKLIVLATDGEPDNCECPDFGDADIPVPAKCKMPGVPQQIKDAVVATAQKIHDDDDIQIHVINVSTPSNAGLQQHLADVAEAGGGNVYPGFSPGDLTTAFEEIIDGVRSCKIDLDGQIAKGKEDTGTVTLDGEKLELDGKHGWQVNSPSQIELLGDACETIKRGTHDLDIKFPCESFDPVVH
jgi:hypothetical protein